jgi:hypothetical protein
MHYISLSDKNKDKHLSHRSVISPTLAKTYEPNIVPFLEKRNKGGVLCETPVNSLAWWYPSFPRNVNTKCCSVCRKPALTSRNSAKPTLGVSDLPQRKHNVSVANRTTSS